MIIKVKVYDIDWNIEEEDFDEEITEEEIEEIIKEMPTEYETEVELDDNLIQDIKEQAGKNNSTFEKELEDFLSEMLIDKVSDDWGYYHDGFNFDIISIEE